MSALDALRAQDVDGALAQLFDEVRAEPEKAKHRVFLFQLLCVAGQWDRALTQLNVARDLDPEADVMAKAYQEILQCEALRREVFAGKRSPLVFGEPEPWLAKLIDALRLDAQGEKTGASQLRQQALEDAPATAGELTVCKAAQGESATDETIDFDWIADGDTRLGPVIEMIVNGRYYWAQWTGSPEIVIDPPADLRDVVWMPASFRWSNEGEAVGVIPTRYVGTEAASDGPLRLARATEWTSPVEDAYVGLGQRTLVTESADFGLMDIRRIALQPKEDA